MLTDYENALFYVLWGEWDNLFDLMIRSEDDLLKKKIQTFLYSYYYTFSEKELIESHENLLAYLDHAIGKDVIFAYSLL